MCIRDRAEAVRKAKQGVSNYLLTGLLYTPEGQAWEGWRGQKYRLKPHGQQPGRYIDMISVSYTHLDVYKRQILPIASRRVLLRELTTL